MHDAIFKAAQKLVAYLNYSWLYKSTFSTCKRRMLSKSEEFEPTPSESQDPKQLFHQSIILQALSTTR